MLCELLRPAIHTALTSHKSQPLGQLQYPPLAPGYLAGPAWKTLREARPAQGLAQTFHGWYHGSKSLQSSEGRLVPPIGMQDHRGSSWDIAGWAGDHLSFHNGDAPYLQLAATALSTKCRSTDFRLNCNINNGPSLFWGVGEPTCRIPEYNAQHSCLPLSPLP